MESKDRAAQLITELSSLGWKYGLTGTLVYNVGEISISDFDELCDELGDFYQRVKYTFEITENFNVKLILD